MNHSDNSHIYSPLDQTASHIRLVHLKPCSNGIDISCSLQIADLEGGECKYEALSYEWGDSAVSRSILLNGNKIQIRENLWWALFYLRRPEEKDRVLWIDALCIDQSNDKERNHQVGLMGRIYSRAQRVIAWLGCDGEDDLREAIYEAQGFKSWYEWTQERIDAAQKPRTDSSTDITQRHYYTGSECGWVAWEKTCNLSYWNRLWIIQELILGRRLLLKSGHTETDWDIVRLLFDDAYSYRDSEDALSARGLGFAYLLPWASDAVKKTLPLQVNQRRSRMHEIYIGENTTLVGQFLLYRTFECADIKDRIFGLLGISPQCCRESIVVDYSTSNTDLALAVIGHHQERHPHFKATGETLQINTRSFIKYLECECDALRIFEAMGCVPVPMYQGKGVGFVSSNSDRLLVGH
ncbi:hypothetical protein VTL71DRAFT_9917 [Oculimacula yallundae]|uniref:Heterokaryon incompatibility domain-containing protein n=1 Tax=Oculimacula yallundae TaxID=86028 RepID=A0ABR4BQY9_9HELO